MLFLSTTKKSENPVCSIYCAYEACAQYYKYKVSMLGNINFYSNKKGNLVVPLFLSDMKVRIMKVLGYLVSVYLDFFLTGTTWKGWASWTPWPAWRDSEYKRCNTLFELSVTCVAPDNLGPSRPAGFRNIRP